MLMHLSPRFSERFCDHASGTHNSIVGKAANGLAYRTRATQHYPTQMINERSTRRPVGLALYGRLN
eukprot:3848493-Pleurochrysis_carterae.AAC.1